MAEIDLPTLVQRIRVDTSGLDRAERVARAFGRNIDGEFTDAGDAADDFARRSAESAEATGKLGEAATEAGDEVRDLGTASRKAADDTDQLNRSVRDTNASAGGAAGVLGRLRDRLRELSDATRLTGQSDRAAAGDSEALRAARTRLVVATNTVAAAERKLAAARTSGDADSIARGEHRLAEALARRAGAQERLTRVSARDNTDARTSALSRFAAMTTKAGNATGILGRTLGLLIVPGVIGALTVAASALTALAAGAVAAVGAIGPLVGVLASLPAAIGALGSTIGVFKGLVKGPAEAAAAVDKAKASTAGYAKATKAAQRQVEDATRRATETQVRGAEAVVDARERVADSISAASRQVENAEEALADAQERSQQAQEDLTRAREDAREELQDLGLSLRGAALDEESAGIALAKARERLEKAKAGGNPRETQEADLAYRQAVLRMDEVIERNEDLRDSAAKAAEAGVEGSDQVKDAQRGILDAQKAEQDGQRALVEAQVNGAKAVADAQRDLSRTIRDTAQANADAQRSVVDAQEAAAAAATSGSSAAADAMKDLTPEARRFADELIRIKKQFKDMREDAQRIALPGLTAGLIAAQNLMPAVRSGYEGIAAVIGRTGEQLGGLAKDGPFAAKFGDVVSSNTKIVGNLGAAVTPLVKALVNVMHAARGMSEAFGGAFQKGAEKLALMSEDGPRMEAFFARVTKLVFATGRVLRDFGVGLKNVFGIGAERIFRTEGTLQAFAKRFRDFTESVSGKSKIAAWFDDLRPVLVETGLLARDLVKAFGGLGSNADTAALIAQLRTELLPALVDLFDIVSDSGISSSIVTLITAFTDLLASMPFSPIVEFTNAVAKVVTVIAELVAANPGLGAVIASLLLFKTALTGIAIAAKITGISSVITGLAAAGPAGAAGAKGMTGFIQGLKGVDVAGNKAVGKSRSFANLLGGGLRKALSIAGKGVKLLIGGVRLLGIAMLTNPIGIAITALVLLGVAFVTLWKRSEKFREIVMGALDTIKEGAGDFVGALIQGFRGLLTVWLTVADGIVSGAAKALGWVPGLGGKLKKANEAFDAMKTGILTTLDETADKAYGFGEDSGENVAKGMSEQAPKVRTAAEALAAENGDVMSGMRDDAYRSGVAAGEGLAQGMASTREAVAATAQRLAIEAGRSMASGLQEKSPSKVTRKIGVYAGQGLSLGMMDTLREVQRSADRMAMAATPRITLPPVTVPEVRIPNPPVPALAGAGARAGRAGGDTIDNSRHYDIDVHETTGPTTADSLTRRLRALDTYGHAALSGRGRT